MYASQLAQSYLLDAVPAYSGLKHDAVGSNAAAAAYAAVFPLEMEAALAAQQQQQQQLQEGGLALPPFVGNTSDTCFTSAELAHYSTDEFRMFAFKVFRCTKRFAHDWRTCPFSHPTENARRRDPNVYRYSAIACPDYKQGFCMRGELCPYAHGVFECWLHPSRYRTQLCKDGTACSRPLCFFAHSLAELRTPTHTWTPTSEDLQPQPHMFSKQPHPSTTAAAIMHNPQGEQTDPLRALSPSNRPKPLHHHHHHHHHRANCSASALGLTAPRMSNAFARRHGLNPKDNAMLNLQKIAIQQAQLANGVPASLPAASGSMPLLKGNDARSSGSSSKHHHNHHHTTEQLLRSSSAYDAGQQRQHAGRGGMQSGSTPNELAGAASVPTSAALPAASSSTAAVATTVAATGAASDGGASSNNSGTSSNPSSSHNSSMHLSNLSADSSGPSSSSASGNSNGNSSSPLSMLPAPAATTANPSFLPSRDALMHNGSSRGRLPTSAHFMDAGAAPSPPLMHFEAALNGSAGAHSNASGSTLAGSGSTGSGRGHHGGMMLPLAWPVTGGGNTTSSAQADAATLAALQQHFQAFTFQPPPLPGHHQTLAQGQEALGGMGMAGFGVGVQDYAAGSAGAEGGVAGMGGLLSQQQQQQQQQHSHQKLLEEYMQSV